MAARSGGRSSRVRPSAAHTLPRPRVPRGASLLRRSSSGYPLRCGRRPRPGPDPLAGDALVHLWRCTPFHWCGAGSPGLSQPPSGSGGRLHCRLPHPLCAYREAWRATKCEGAPKNCFPSRSGPRGSKAQPGGCGCPPSYLENALTGREWTQPGPRNFLCQERSTNQWVRGLEKKDGARLSTMTYSGN